NAVFRKQGAVPKGPDAKPFASFSSNSKRTGSVDDNRVGNVGPRQTVVTPENVAKVSVIVQQNPRNTVRRIASETGLKLSSSETAYGCFLKKSKVIRPYPLKLCDKGLTLRTSFYNDYNKGFDVAWVSVHR
ncbi:hypothetical protein AVEN_263602-1, partial [Araneus ventricosus]